MLKFTPQILRIATGYGAREPNVQLLNSQNEKMQTEFAIARKTWREWIWIHLVFLLQNLLTTASASITRCFGANAKKQTNKFIDSFWVSNWSIRLRVENKDRPCVITHISDFLAMIFLQMKNRSFVAILFFVVFSLYFWVVTLKVHIANLCS